jgi:hypothetical protein
MNDKAFEKAGEFIKLMQERGYECSVEYPGFFLVEVKGYWWFGFGRDGWCGQLWYSLEDYENDGPCRYITFHLSDECSDMNLIYKYVMHLFKILCWMEKDASYKDSKVEITCCMQQV